MYEKLTNIPIELTKTEDVINYLLDNNFIGIVNDCGIFQVEYDLNDLLQTWDRLDLIRCVYNEMVERVKV